MVRSHGAERSRSVENVNEEEEPHALTFLDPAQLGDSLSVRVIGASGGVLQAQSDERGALQLK